MKTTNLKSNKFRKNYFFIKKEKEEIDHPQKRSEDDLILHDKGHQLADEIVQIGEEIKLLENQNLSFVNFDYDQTTTTQDRFNKQTLELNKKKINDLKMKIRVITSNYKSDLEFNAA